MATLSVIVPDGAVATVKTAVGKVLRLGRDATTAEVEEFCRRYLKDTVQRDEQTAIAATNAIFPDP